MHSLDTLHMRLSKMLTAIDQQQQAVATSSLFMMHLFTVEEQDKLIELTDLLATKCKQTPQQFIDLRNLTDQELHTLKLWAQLQKALYAEDVVAASQYRYELAAAA